MNLNLLRAALSDPAAARLALDRELCERSLSEFLKRAWPSIVPNAYAGGWHLDCMADHLEAVSRGEIRRLLINIPPRMTKPVSQHARIFCRAKGLVPLREIAIGDEVWTHKGRWRTVTNVLPQGKLPVLRVRTITGRETVATADHPFLTSEGWKQLGDIRPDDVVAVTPCYSDDAGVMGVFPETARLLGYLIGDGHCGGTPNITCGDDEEAQDILHCIQHTGFRGVEQKYKIQSKGGWLRRISIRAVRSEVGRIKKGQLGPVRRWLDQFGIMGKSSYTKTVPEEIMRGTREIVANFLGAYWACDGYISLRGKTANGDVRPDLCVGCDSVNKELMEQIQLLLLRLGIRATIRKKVTNLKTARQGDKYTSYCLTITTQDDCYRFWKNIPFRHAKKSRFEEARLRRFDFDREVIGESVVSIERDGEEECICLRVDEDHSFTADGFAVHNTLLVSVAWPCWLWAQKPDPQFPLLGPGCQILAVAYGDAKAQEDAVTARRLISSEWYQQRWGDRVVIAKDRDNQERYDTTAGGSRISVGINASVLGRGGLVKIIDDPAKSQDMDSEISRATVIRSYDETLSSRENDPRISAEVCIAQRLHENDLPGHILDKYSESGDVVHVNLPMEYDHKRHFSSAYWEDPRGCDEDGNVLPEEERALRDGTSLNPERFPPDVIRERKKSESSYSWSALYQQAPVPRGGGVIHPEWWMSWPPSGIEEFDASGKPLKPLAFPTFEYIVAALDTALTSKSQNDPSAMTVWGVFRDTGDQAFNTRETITGERDELPREYASGPKIMLVSAWSSHLEFHDLLNKVMTTCRVRRVDRLIIEAKTAGHSVAQELQRLLKGEQFSVMLQTPKGDKDSRLYSCAHLFEAGLVYAPNRNWARRVQEQCSAGSRGQHDDLADTTSAALRHLRNLGEALTIREHERETLDDMTWQGDSEPLYDV